MGINSVELGECSRGRGKGVKIDRIDGMQAVEEGS